jgi:hypothetical protein
VDRFERLEVLALCAVGERQPRRARRPRVLNPTPHLWNRAVNAYSVATSLAAATHDLGLRSVLGKEVNEP